MTGAPDIFTEWDIAKAEFRWSDYKTLLGLADKRALAVAYCASRFGAAEIIIEDGKWRRQFRGARAIIVPVVTRDEVVDLIAFLPETPRSFWGFVTSPVATLGEDEIIRADIMREPLQVHECPLDWIRAGGLGCVILDWARYWPLHLAGVPALQFEDREFAARATARMQRPMPVPPAMVRAAA